MSTHATVRVLHKYDCLLHYTMQTITHDRWGITGNLDPRAKPKAYARGPEYCVIATAYTCDGTVDMSHSGSPFLHMPPTVADKKGHISFSFNFDDVPF